MSALEGAAMSALDDLQAVLLLAKHLDALLPFLLALRRIPGKLPQRVGLLQGIAKEIASDGEFAADWYGALELLSGEDLSCRSVADLMALSVDLLSNERLGDVWGTAFRIGLFDESLLQRWVVFDGLTNRKSV